MNVAWVINVPMSAVSQRLSLQQGGSGYWLSSLGSEIQKLGIDLTIVHPSHRVRSCVRFAESGIRYCVVPFPLSAHVMRPRRRGFLQVLAREVTGGVYPDIIDFHGTEYCYGLANAYTDCASIVTIQGIISDLQSIANGGDAALKLFVKLLRGGAGIQEIVLQCWTALLLHARSQTEKRVFLKHRYFIGRTDYDRASVAHMQPNAGAYFSIPRILRKSFYQTAWTGPNPGEVRLFHCGRILPSKGTELLIDALAIIRRDIPNATLRIGGARGDQTAWTRYLTQKAKRLQVDQGLHFLGYLGEASIANELSMASAFLFPSYGENSPNAVAEAMHVGVPIVASNVGGVKSMLCDGREGLLFPSGDYRQLAAHVIKLSREQAFSYALGKSAAQRAKSVHEPSRIAAETVQAYETVRKLHEQMASGIC